MDENKPGKSQFRSFGLIVGMGFSIIAVWPTLFRGESPRTWILGIGLVLAATGLIAPAVLRPAFRVWMAIGGVLGWVNTRIILMIVYYGLIVPTGLVLRVLNKDPMGRRFERDATTYRIPRDKRPATHMLRQY
jgi:hypothetical protein